MKKLEYHQKFFIKFVLIISAIAIAILFFNLIRISTIKAKIIEEAINTAYEVKFKNVSPGDLKVELAKPVQCSLAGLSSYKCSTNNVKLHIDNEAEIAKASNITLKINTPLLATSLEELISPSTKIYIEANGIDVALWEDLFEAKGLSDEVKKAINSYIVPHAKNIAYKGIIKNINIKEKNHKGIPVKVFFNFLSEMNSNYLRATYEMALLFERYESLKEFVVVRQPIQTSDLNQTLASMEEVVYVAKQDLFIDKVKLCFESKNSEFIKKGFYSYYQMLYSFIPDKLGFNRAVLNIDTDKMIEYNSFANTIKPLVKEATNTKLFGIDQLIFNFIDSVYDDGIGVCETTIAKKGKRLSMSGIGALSSQNFYAFEDVVKNHFDMNLTKRGVHENTDDWFK